MSVGPGQDVEAALNQLVKAEIHLKELSTPYARIMRDEAAARLYRAVIKANTLNESAVDAAEKNAALLESTETSSEVKDFLTASAILMGVAILSGAVAGVAGALVVKEQIVKELIKGAISGFVTTSAAMTAERVLTTRRPSRNSKPEAAHASSEALYTDTGFLYQARTAGAPGGDVDFLSSREGGFFSGADKMHPTAGGNDKGPARSELLDLPETDELRHEESRENLERRRDRSHDRDESPGFEM